MGTYKKILVAIDGSDFSLHALRESFKLAFHEGSWITVVSVAPRYEGDLSLVGVGNVLGTLRSYCEKALSKAEEIAKSSGALIKTVCEEGEPYERIVDLAEAENCDLIVLGRKGTSGLERVFVGSVAARVIGYSQRDVLIIPARSEFSWQRVLLATDGSIHGRAAADRAIKFAQAYGGELKVISVVDVPSALYGVAPQAVEDMVKKTKGYVGAVKTMADSAGLKAETFVLEGEEAYQKITEFAKEHNINMIVLGSHGRTGLKRLLMGSVAEKTIGYAHCPVLVVRA
jgi:nucleotide-binding universal stress UspA family protein